MPTTTRIVAIVPQSWWHRGGAIGVVDGHREANFPALWQPSTGKVNSGPSPTNIPSLWIFTYMIIDTQMSLVLHMYTNFMCNCCTFVVIAEWSILVPKLPKHQKWSKKLILRCFGKNDKHMQRVVSGEDSKTCLVF